MENLIGSVVIENLSYGHNTILLDILELVASPLAKNPENIYKASLKSTTHLVNKFKIFSFKQKTFNKVK